jgi:hypothetical protein
MKIGIIILLLLLMHGFQEKEVYLGRASIIGSGDSSVLEAVAENDILIRINSATRVDFYIEYNITCEGSTDEGIITLVISLNGENITPAVVQTPTSKKGKLIVEDVPVKRGDKLTFIIEVIYFSLIPPYTNETRAVGAGIIRNLNLSPLPFPLRNDT